MRKLVFWLCVLVPLVAFAQLWQMGNFNIDTSYNVTTSGAMIPTNGIQIPGFNATNDYVWTATNTSGLGHWAAAPGAAGGEANYVSHIGNTNSSDRFSLWHSKAGVTNYLVTISAGNGITITNETTNLVLVAAAASGEANYNGHADGSTNTTTAFSLVYGKLGVTNLLNNLVEGDNNIDISMSNPSNIAFSAASTLTLDTEWDTSSEIATAVGDETGTGNLVFSDNPTFDLGVLFNHLTANRAVYLDANKRLTNSAGVDSTELELLDGVTGTIANQSYVDTATNGLVPILMTNAVTVGSAIRLNLVDGAEITSLATNSVGTNAFALVIAAGITRDTEWDTSAEIAAAVSDEVGSAGNGKLVFNNLPRITNLLAVAGSASAPSIAAFGDTATGINFDAGENIYLYSDSTLNFYSGTSPNATVITNKPLRVASSLHMPILTASRVAIVNSANQITNDAAVDLTELSYLDGVTSAIQTQLDAKQAQDAFLDDIAALTDPNADRLLGWDDTDGDVRWFTIGSGLTYTAGTDTLSASAGSPTIQTNATAVGSEASINLIPDTSISILATNVTGTNQIGISVADRYRTVWLDAGLFKAHSTTNPPATFDYEPGGTDGAAMDGWAFDGSTAEYIQAKFAISDWDGGTIKAKFYWTQNYTNSGVSVVWAISAGTAADADPLGSILGTEILTTNAVESIDDLAVTDATNPVTVAGSPADDDMVFVRVRRRPDDAGDDFSMDDAKLLGVLIQYLEDSTPQTAW